MKIAEADILMVPGWGNSGPGHWQHRWHDKINNAQWVVQENWELPTLEPWVSNIEHAVAMATRPVVLVGHSLGVLAIVHAAQRFKDTKVRGALLVCPPDMDDANNKSPETLQFANPPRDPLPFPSLLVASSNDPFCAIERAADMAMAWGSEFHNAGDAGHIDNDSGHGPWPEGLMMFTRLMQRIKA